MTPEDRIIELAAENARQREQIALWLVRVPELEARLATAATDSQPQLQAAPSRPPATG